MDKLRALHTFVAIADAGSLTAAARALGSSLPAVVRLLAGLEGELGVRLFQRTTRRLALTEAGRRYLQRVRQLQTLLEEAEADARAEQTELRGTLSVTAPVLFGTRHVASGVTLFVQRHREVQVELQLLDRVVNLVEEGIDVGVRIGELEDSSLIARPVSTLRRLTVAAPAYLKRTGTPQHPRQLLEHNCITRLDSSAGGWSFVLDGKLRSVPVRGTLRVNQTAVAAQACVAGLGIGSFLAYQVASELAEGSLQILLSDFELPPRPIHIVYPQARLLPARTRVFIDFLLGYLQEQRAAWQPAQPRRRAGRKR